MEQINDREQPKVDEQTLVQEEHISVQDTTNGSLLNTKFKTSEDLLKAYENLEKEYTRKCQKLASFEKELDNAKAPNKNENLLSELNKFYEKNPLAKDFQNELLSKGLERNDISQEKLMEDYVNVLGQAYRLEKEKNSSEDFLLDKIKNDDTLKNKIIGDYIDKVSLNKTAPLVRAGGGGYIISPNATPKTLTEAGLLAKQILK